MNNSSTIFRADVFSLSDVGSLEQRSKMIAELYELKKLYPEGIAHSNIGCWRYNLPFDDLDWLIQPLDYLLNQAVQFYLEADNIFAQNYTTNDVDIQFWANINEPNSRNSMHSHKPAQFSACYYLQGTDTGLFRFINPANLVGDCNTKAPFTRDFFINPKDGDLILWPSWMPHEVETNFSKKDRVNLAFDFRFK